MAEGGCSAKVGRTRARSVRELILKWPFEYGGDVLLERNYSTCVDTPETHKDRMTPTFAVYILYTHVLCLYAAPQRAIGPLSPFCWFPSRPYRSYCSSISSSFRLLPLSSHDLFSTWTCSNLWWSRASPVVLVFGALLTGLGAGSGPQHSHYSMDTRGWNASTIEISWTDSIGEETEKKKKKSTKTTKRGRVAEK